MTRITPQHYAKYRALLALIDSQAFDWSKRSYDDRLVIFSERLETLNFLESRLQQDLKLNQNQITQLHGGMSDLDQQRIVERSAAPTPNCGCCFVRMWLPKASICTTSAIA